MNSPNTPTTWLDFRNALLSEFVTSDHTRRARDKLRSLKQMNSVEKYLPEYRNLILMIGDMNEGEKVDRFVDGLKYNVRVEVLKSNCNSFEECARLALNVDSELWIARRGNPGFHFNNNNQSNADPTPMEIGNINGDPPTRALREQRKKDMERGACFKCHKVGCRPWKCRPAKVNNFDVQIGPSTHETSTAQLSDSENE